MIEVARLHAADAGLAIDYRVAAAEELAARAPAGFRRGHLHGDARARARAGGHGGDARARCCAPGGALFVSTLNRNLRTFLTAIVGGEYLLRLIPRGTHEYERLIRPAELARWARAAGLTLDRPGGHRAESRSPATSRLSATSAVNYLAHFSR